MVRRKNHADNKRPPERWDQQTKEWGEPSDSGPKGGMLDSIGGGDGSDFHFPVNDDLAGSYADHVKAVAGEKKRAEVAAREAQVIAAGKRAFEENRAAAELTRLRAQQADLTPRGLPDATGTPGKTPHSSRKTGAPSSSSSGSSANRPLNGSSTQDAKPEPSSSASPSSPAKARSKRRPIGAPLGGGSPNTHEVSASARRADFNESKAAAERNRRKVLQQQQQQQQQQQASTGTHGSESSSPAASPPRWPKPKSGRSPSSSSSKGQGASSALPEKLQKRLDKRHAARRGASPSGRAAGTSSGPSAVALAAPLLGADAAGGSSNDHEGAVTAAIAWDEMTLFGGAAPAKPLSAQPSTGGAIGVAIGGPSSPESARRMELQAAEVLVADQLERAKREVQEHKERMRVRRLQMEAAAAAGEAAGSAAVVGAVQPAALDVAVRSPLRDPTPPPAPSATSPPHEASAASDAGNADKREARRLADALLQGTSTYEAVVERASAAAVHAAVSLAAAPAQGAELQPPPPQLGLFDKGMRVVGSTAPVESVGTDSQPPPQPPKEEGRKPEAEVQEQKPWVWPWQRQPSPSPAAGGDAPAEAVAGPEAPQKSRSVESNSRPGSRPAINSPAGVGQASPSSVKTPAASGRRGPSPARSRPALRPGASEQDILTGALTSGVERAFEAELTGGVLDTSDALRSRLTATLGASRFEVARAALLVAAMGDGDEDEWLANGGVQQLLGEKHTEVLPLILKLIFIEAQQ